jgi:hypothetical protein
MNSVAPFAHEALFYRDEDDFLDGTASFVADGVNKGEPVLVAVPDASDWTARPTRSTSST